jgi:predicted dehydrogenase
MQRTGRKLMVYQPHRVTAETCALKSILASGWLGELYLIRHSVTRYARRTDWQAFLKHGGGMLNNYGAHFIDQFLYLNQAPFRKFRCELRAVATLGDAEDVVKAVLTAENGVMLDLDINMAAAAPVPAWYIAGKCGAAVFTELSQEWTVTYFDPHELAALKPQEGLAAANRAYGNGETIPWKTRTVRNQDFEPLDFYAKCREYFVEGGAPFVPVTETREVMRALAECRRDAGWNE